MIPSSDQGPKGAYSYHPLLRPQILTLYIGCSFYHRCHQHWSSNWFISYSIFLAISVSVHNRRVSTPSWAAEHRKSSNKGENHTPTYVVHQSTLFYMVSHIRRIILSAFICNRFFCDIFWPWNDDFIRILSMRFFRIIQGLFLVLMTTILRVIEKYR